jgi:indolepyruvate ferredoxin oxidoreductase beta subunit
MTAKPLAKDPYNLIITGVGGQGNVMASRVLGNMIVRNGYHVTIGETFGASQRGGSVMSHLRVSAEGSWSPQIPEGQADFIIALEPSEALRLLSAYGNPQVRVLSNTRPIHPVDVIAGDAVYPSMDEIRSSIEELTADAWFVAATDEAVKMGNPIYGNIIILGALAGTGAFPMDRESFKAVIAESFPEDRVDANVRAYDLGMEMVSRRKQAHGGARLG